MEVALTTLSATSLSFFESISKATNLYLFDLFKLFKMGVPAFPKPITPIVMILSVSYTHLTLPTNREV